MRRVLLLLPLCGCAHTLTENLTTAQSYLDLAEMAALKVAEEYCKVVPEDECRAMQEETAKVAEGMNVAKGVIGDQMNTAADIDRALETRKKQ